MKSLLLVLCVPWVALASMPPSALVRCQETMLRHGAPRLNYDFVGYLARVNEGEIRHLPAGVRYYVEKTYRQGWDVSYEAMLEEHVPYLRLVDAETVERELRRDVQLVLESFRSRRGFNRRRLEWIREAEKKLPLHRMYHLKIRTADDLTEEFVRLFDGTVAPDAAALVKDEARAPFERHTKYVAPEREESIRTGKMIAVVELGRAYKWGMEEDSPETFLDLVAEVATYLEHKYLRRGIEVAIYIHTDTIGATRLFPRFGFNIVQTPEQLGEPDEYVLRQDGRKLVEKYGSRAKLWRRLWMESGPRRLSAIEMYDAPRDVAFRRHPILRPTIAMCPRFRDAWQISPNPDVVPPELADPIERAWYEVRAAFPLQRALQRDWSLTLLKSYGLSF